GRGGAAGPVAPLRADLGGALPVALQQPVLAGGELRFHRLPGGALPVAVHPRVLEEVAGRHHPLEFGRADEVVVLVVALARARRARGEGNGQADVGVARQAGVDDARLARARRRRDDEKGPAHAHSMFCACSRIWSISTLSSTAAAEVRASTDFDPRVFASRLNSCSRKSRRRPTGASWRSTRRSSATWLSS